MARIESFVRDLRLATESVEPKAVARDLAAYARAELARSIAEGEASDRYDRYVNGVLGQSEDAVVPPGPILYEFHWWNEIIEWSLEVLRKRAPVKTGRYRDSWFAMVNSAPVEDYSTIPIHANVVLVNDQPYSRKIEVGFMKMSVPHGVAQDSAVTIKSRFGNVISVKVTMVRLPNPYILKGRFRKGIRPNSRTKLRKDTMAGAEMTYPAIVMSMR